MADQGDQRHRTYRCPVCGHRDAAVPDADDGRIVVACSHCGTPLSVWPRGPDSVRLFVQVAGDSGAR